MLVSYFYAQIMNLTYLLNRKSQQLQGEHNLIEARTYY